MNTNDDMEFHDCIGRSLTPILKKGRKKKTFLLTGPTNLQEAKSLQPPFGSSTHLKGKVNLTSSAVFHKKGFIKYWEEKVRLATCWWAHRNSHLLGNQSDRCSWQSTPSGCSLHSGDSHRYILSRGLELQCSMIHVFMSRLPYSLKLRLRNISCPFLHVNEQQAQQQSHPGPAGGPVWAFLSSLLLQVWIGATLSTADGRNDLSWNSSEQGDQQAS